MRNGITVKQDFLLTWRKSDIGGLIYHLEREKMEIASTLLIRFAIHAEPEPNKLRDLKLNLLK